MGEKYEVQSTKYKRKWEAQSSKDEQRPANPKLRTSSFVPRILRCTALNIRSQDDPAGCYFTFTLALTLTANSLAALKVGI
jgi:hypothetical protein